MRTNRLTMSSLCMERLRPHLRTAPPPVSAGDGCRPSRPASTGRASESGGFHPALTRSIATARRLLLSRGSRAVDVIVSRIPYVILLILSLSVHEWAHAFSAWKLGDDTAATSGRMTLNPLAHIDPLGTLILPLLGIPFGWAKPVPVNPTRFRRDFSMGAGMAITASAGPISNVILAVLAAVGIGLGARFELAGDGLLPQLLWGLLGMNVGLAIFNLIPLPPLDGSRIVAWLIPYRLRDQWHALERFAPLLLVAIFVFGGRLVTGPVNLLGGLLVQLARLVA